MSTQFTIKPISSLEADPARDERFMRMALVEAEAATRTGDVPIGAVIVDADGIVIGRGRNRREENADPTAHAEVEALREAARNLGHWRVEGTLYVTLEPCMMCAGALVNARVKRVVFGAFDPKAGAVKSLFSIGSDTRLNHRFEIQEGVLDAEAVALLQAFFKKLRAEGQK